jgi:hypothetical protein
MNNRNSVIKAKMLEGKIFNLKCLGQKSGLHGWKRQSLRIQFHLSASAED